ncbi:hypothetical protein CXB51_025779 [Gossypium anomalum]|uniref:DUF7745 domain-containing protein n=1 Tax=Gossypium anomalum TaxID=47600 RepID=A0A8J5YKD3_9ROSI|nr:hypothetical protein CXB51_025779 [Gossypium anomalum]
MVKLIDMTDTWAEKIKKKNEVVCIPWFSLRDLVLSHPDMLKRVNLFALAIYGLIVFPKILGNIEVALVDFFERLKQRINPVPTILAETFRSLSSCRKGEGRFIGCAQLLNNLRAEDVTWRALWIRPSVLLYKVMRRNWIRPVNGPKAILFTTIHTRHRRISTVRVCFRGEGIYEEGLRYRKVLEENSSYGISSIR